jgi:broad specificity phosphatase PhoE
MTMVNRIPGVRAAVIADSFAYKSLPWVTVFSSPLHPAVTMAKPLCEAAGIRMQLNVT